MVFHEPLGYEPFARVQHAHSRAARGLLTSLLDQVISLSTDASVLPRVLLWRPGRAPAKAP